MHKQIFCFVLMSVFFFCSYAQKGNNTLTINGEASIPFFQNDIGFGGFIQGAHGIGKSAQLTLSGGILKFHTKNSIETGKVTTRLVPFLFGYKQNIQKMFIEPKIGLGELGGKILIDGDYSRPSVAAMFGGLSAGYTFNRFNIAINFLTGHGIENNSAGIWYNKNFHYTSISAGYDLFSKKKH